MKLFTYRSRLFVLGALALASCSGKHTVEIPEYQDLNVASWLCERFVCSNIIDAGPDMGMDLGVDLAKDQGFHKDLDASLPDSPVADTQGYDVNDLDMLLPDTMDATQPDSEPQGCVWSLELQGPDEAIMEPNGLPSYAEPQPNTITFVFENTGDTFYCKVLAAPGASAKDKLEISPGQVAVLPGNTQTIEVTFVPGWFQGAAFGEHELPVDFYIDEEKEVTHNLKVTVYNPGTFFFTKDSDQPVLSGTPGEWDEWNIFCGDVIKTNGVYQMWYAGHSNDVRGIGFATSLDGTSWEKHPQNPVLIPEEPWEMDGLNCPSVVFDGSTYHVFYGADEEGEDEVTRIGYASSLNGIDWNKSANNPIMEPNTQNNEVGIGPISVILDNGIFKGWYLVQQHEPLTLNWDETIEYATSSDGQTWSQNSSGSIDGYFTASVKMEGFDVIKDDIAYRMFFTADTWANDFGQFSSRGVYVLLSEDGITWSDPKDVSVLDSINPNEWELLWGSLSVVREDLSTLRFWYSGYLSDDVDDEFENVKIGAATAHAPGFLDFEVSLDPSVTCGSSGDSDCTGTLVVGAGKGITFPYMQMGAMYIDDSADLSGNKTIQGTLDYVPAGTVQATAYFVDNATGTFYLTEGDLKESIVKPVTIQSNETSSESFSLSRLSKGANTVSGYVEVDSSNQWFCQQPGGHDCEGLLTVYATLETGGKMYSSYSTTVDLKVGNAYFELYDLPLGIPVHLCAFLQDASGDYENFIESGDLALLEDDCPIVTLPDSTEQLITLDLTVYFDH